MNMLTLAMVYEDMADQFDIIHSHVDFHTLPFAAKSPTPTVLTMHGRLDTPDYFRILNQYRNMAYISISDSQRTPVPDINWAATIYHGYPETLFSFNADPEDYFLYLGRFSEEKRPDQAIMLAKACNIRLKIAAKIDPVDREYFKSRIEPLLNSPLIEYVGEVGDERKIELLRNAKALLNTIDWPEPFGLVMIEAMGCGTPVIVRRCGSAPEIITNGVNGFICDSKLDFINAIHNVDKISRVACRQEFEKRFTQRHMTDNYEALYYRIMAASALRLPVERRVVVNGAEIAA
jgi:glycosyltransferase involved in cell wall biosynthesis